MIQFFADDRLAAVDETFVGSPYVTSSEDAAIARLASGGYAVGYVVNRAIMVQRYDVDGAPTGSPLALTSGGSTTMNSSPSIAGLPNGGYVVSWVDASAHVVAQVFDGSGSATTGIFGVGTPTNYQQQPSIVTLANGDFVVAWTFNGAASNIRAQVFHADGSAASAEIVATGSSFANSYHPEVAALANGGFVLSWSGGFDQDGGATIRAQAYTGSGQAQGSAVRVPNDVSYHDNTFQSVAATSDGGYMLTWTEAGDVSGVTSKVMAQLYDAGGTARGARFQVNSDVTYNAGQASVAAMADGGFLVTWKSDVPGDGPNYFQSGDVKAQFLDAAGSRIGSEFRVNEITESGQDMPIATAFGTGDAAIVWRRFDASGTATLAIRNLYSVTDGTAGPDTMTGTGGVDVLRGLGGNDTIMGGGGADLIFAGDGNDTVIGGDGQRGTTDLGAGDDLYRATGSTLRRLNVEGGDGFDTLEIANTYRNIVGVNVKGVERLLLTEDGNFQGFSGFQSIVLAKTSPLTFYNFVDSANPLADLTIAGQFVSMTRSTMRSITGGATADNLTLGQGVTVDTVDLGDANDQLTLDQTFGGTAPVFSRLSGGAGTDFLNITVGDGLSRSYDLATVSGFERLGINVGYSYKGAVQVANVHDVATIMIGGNTYLTLSATNLPDMLVQSISRGGITLAADTMIGRYGFPDDGPYDRPTNIDRRDATLSAEFVNHGTVRGTIAFYTGDDLYDGRDGVVGGTVFGNGGNDTLLGGAGAERFEGGYGDDRIRGGAGNDILIGDAGNDRIDGGAGFDIAGFATMARVATVRFDGGTIIVDSAEGRDVLTGVEQLRFAGQQIDVMVAASVGDLYQDYMGRAANGAELGYWTDAVQAGRATLAGVRDAILADAGGRAHTAAEITALYQTLGGRAPTSGELTYWQGAVRGGQDFDDIRTTILADPLGRTAGAIIDLYHDYGGRAPTADEIGYWRGQVAGGATLSTVRSAILADPLGRDHLRETIGDLYRDYGGRDPGVEELSVWQGLIAGGLTYEQARGIIVADRLGQDYLPTGITAAYRDHFGRGPDAAELAAWQGLLSAGTTWDQMTDTLLRDPGAAGAGVRRFAGTAAADTFEIAGGHDAVITGFDPLHDLIVLSDTDRLTLDALDPRQTYALDGTPDVLLTAPDGSEILLTGMLLDDLRMGHIG